MAEPSVLQKKTEIFLERDIYPLLKNFPASEKFSLCQEIKQSCYKLIRAAVMANNLTNVNRRLMWLDEADAEKTLLLVLLGVAKNQKYITQKKLLELQGKLEEIGRIIGGLQKFFINNRKWTIRKSTAPTQGYLCLASNRAIRGYNSARNWNNNNATNSNPNLGFRPAL